MVRLASFLALAGALCAPAAAVRCTPVFDVSGLDLAVDAAATHPPIETEAGPLGLLRSSLTSGTIKIELPSDVAGAALLRLHGAHGPIAYRALSPDGEDLVMTAMPGRTGLDVFLGGEHVVRRVELTGQGSAPWGLSFAELCGPAFDAPLAQRTTYRQSHGPYTSTVTLTQDVLEVLPPVIYPGVATKTMYIVELAVTRPALSVMSYGDEVVPATRWLTHTDPASTHTVTEWQTSHTEMPLSEPFYTTETTIPTTAHSSTVTEYTTVSG